MTDDLPPPPAARPLWLVTLADLALLLLGFMVLIQTTEADGRAVAAGLRNAFGASPADAPMPLAAAGLSFAPGSAVAAADDALAAWARDASRDPRVVLTVTGHVDGTPADVDPATGSAALLAADRARAAAAAIAAAVPGARLVLAAGAAPHRREAIVTLGFAGPDPTRKPVP